MAKSRSRPPRRRAQAPSLVRPASELPIGQRSSKAIPPVPAWKAFYRKHVPAPIRGWIRRNVIAVHQGSRAWLRQLLDQRATNKLSLQGSVHAKLVASELRKSGYFDERFYALSAEARAKKIEPAFHYITVGEARGFAPSAKFDPLFYKDAYPDIAAISDRINALYHYVCHGKSEGRVAVPIADWLEFPTRRIDAKRQCIVVMAHEASRTGAPILGWNIVKTLSKRFNVVVVLVEGGPIEEAFEEFSVAVIKPPSGSAFHPAEAKYLVRRIVDLYRPIYVIANSVETRRFVPAFARAGIPVIALVHGFSGNTRPRGLLNQVYGWAARNVFSSKLVADSSRVDYPILEVREVSILPQGPSALPSQQSDRKQERTPVKTATLRLKRSPDDFLIVGMGAVHIRKGVDLFIAVAADTRRLAPTAKVRFAWVGSGYKPKDDVGYSVYLAEQIERSAVGDNIVFVDEVSDLGPIYAQSDLFLLSSRLDPLPNVAIDAMLRGIPVICFENATGLAEILAADAATRHLVVPHIDIAAAARMIVKLANDRPSLRALSHAVEARAQSTFDMERYVTDLDRIGHQRAAEWKQIEKDRATIAESKALDAKFYLRPKRATSGEDEALADYLVQSHLLRPRREPDAAKYLRRPAAGFNPLIYACENRQFDADTREDPFAHFLRSGQPEGPWTHAVIQPPEYTSANDLQGKLRVALHGHFHYPELLPDLVQRLALNRSLCDLFLTTTGPDKLKVLQAATRKYARGKVEVSLIPNRGRDIGGFFTQLRGRLSTGYDVVGHVHGKRSPLDDDSQMGDRWREFLWSNLIGSKAPMMDIILARFVREGTLGLVFPEDPNFVSWDGNREIAERLMERMGLRQPFPIHFDFPIGTMFWARPSALKPLFDLALAWNDYPPEPVPYDGTMLHAIERLLPFVARSQGYTYATTHVPGITR